MGQENINEQWRIIDRVKFQLKHDEQSEEHRKTRFSRNRWAVHHQPKVMQKKDLYVYGWDKIRKGLLLWIGQETKCFFWLHIWEWAVTSGSLSIRPHLPQGSTVMNGTHKFLKVHPLTSDAFNW